MNNAVDVLVLGGGPGGYTAALYAARAGLSVLVLERLSAGGQMATTGTVENYPGFEDGVDGFELGEKMQRQAQRFGARTVLAEVREVALTESPKRVETDRGTFLGRTVVVATGAEARELGVPGEAALRGRGVSYCATCDGMLYRGKPVAVVGYTDTARQEAEFLQKIGCSVTYFDRPKQCEIRGDGRAYLRRAVRGCGGRLHPAAHHGPHGAVPGAGGGTGLCDGGPAYGHQSPRPVCRGRLHRRSPSGLQGRGRWADRRAECGGLGGGSGAPGKTELNVQHQI